MTLVTPLHAFFLSCIVLGGVLLAVAACAWAAGPPGWFRKASAEQAEFRRLLREKNRRGASHYDPE